jgi:Uma2 family endonuclease
MAAVISALGAEDTITFPEIAWDTYCRLNDENSSPSIRMSYWKGALEIMTVSARHEYWGRSLESLVRTYANALRLDVISFGSLTMRRSDLQAGLEPDACFYFGPMAAAMRGRSHLDLHTDPAPDLAVEIDISRRSFSKLPLYAALGIREIWRFHQEEVFLHELAEGEYRSITASAWLPRLSGAQLRELLAESLSLSSHEWDERIRAAAQGQ